MNAVDHLSIPIQGQGEANSGRRLSEATTRVPMNTPELTCEKKHLFLAWIEVVCGFNTP
jgi:hypothetical protein